VKPFSVLVERIKTVAKKVELWESDNGLFFPTEEEAIEADQRDKAWKRFQELSKDKIGSSSVVSTTFDVLWKNRKELIPLLNEGI
jgi:hypothetical protein